MERACLERSTNYALEKWCNCSDDDTVKLLPVMPALYCEVRIFAGAEISGDLVNEDRVTKMLLLVSYFINSLRHGGSGSLVVVPGGLD